ncbi:MAG: AtpZ/AtpI family protein [Myxococcota bacterium]
MSPDQLKVFGRVGGLGLEMAAYLLIFVKGGEWLDGRFETAPVLERVGVGLGLFAGFYALWKLARSPTKQPTPDHGQEEVSAGDPSRRDDHTP